MPPPGKADPTLYPKLREHALSLRLPGVAPHAVQAVLMDWHVRNGTVTALASANGSASIYLSSGGGFIGGGEKFPAIGEAARHAVDLASTLLPQFTPAPNHHLPPAGQIFFFLTTAGGLLRGSGSAANIQAGTSPLASLAAAMQAVISAYRSSYA